MVRCCVITLVGIKCRLLDKNNGECMAVLVVCNVYVDGSVVLGCDNTGIHLYSLANEAEINTFPKIMDSTADIVS